MSRRASLDPELSPGYQVRRCHRRFDRLLNARLAPHGLKAGFWYYLRVLWQEDGLTQKQLSDLTNVRENTTVAMIGGMVQQDLVRRVPDPDDRRKLRIYLTDEGRALETKLIDQAIDINAVAVRDIAPADVATCLAVLAKMSANLDREMSSAKREDRQTS